MFIFDYYATSVNKFFSCYIFAWLNSTDIFIINIVIEKKKKQSFALIYYDTPPSCLFFY